jgi:hypothetical protein
MAKRFVDVSHEALIRGWPRLRRWLDEDRVGLRLHRRITEAAQEWERSDRDSDLLYRGAIGTGPSLIPWNASSWRKAFPCNTASNGTRKSEENAN